ncbi:MAG: hypothetical protein K2O18_07705, partial [Oscillospiraceae bacterium]|nr:hypothetical protein [Oscillospiraceae bacterium]
MWKCWECIERAKGIMPDEYDQILDNMIERTLEGEIIPFDEWQDLVDDLSEEEPPSAAEILQEHHLTMPELVIQAEAGREVFLAALRQYDLPIENRFELCRKLCELAEAQPSDMLLRLYCDIVSDNGFLLDLERAVEEESYLCWLSVQERSSELYEYLSGQKRTAERFRETLEQVQTTRRVPVSRAKEDTRRQNAVFQAYMRIFELSEGSQRFLDNILWLLQTADSSPALTAIKPLFLYRVLTRHGSRLRTNDGLRINYRSLWKYQRYIIDQDNGKNYKRYMQYISLFDELCGIFQSDSRVDIPLCLYGFDHLSNLGEILRWSPRSHNPFGISLAPTVEEIMFESTFSCFENSADDNVVCMDYDISWKELNRFRSSTESRLVRAAKRIDNYMNRHLDELLTRFLNADSVGIKALCAEILEAVKLPAAQQPKNMKETALFLAGINDCLMEAVDEI